MLLRSSLRLFVGTFASLSLAVVALAGCPDPQGSFDAFGDRYDKINGGGTTTSTTSGNQGGGCAADPGQLDGTFLFALSAKLSPKKPVLFSMALTTTEGANGLSMHLAATPLDGMDHMTPVDAEVDLGNTDVAADGTFVANLGTINVSGAANTITVGSPITAENVVLTGSLCASDPDFICGSVDGKVTAPIMYPLAGSTFTMQRIVDGTIPAPVINCAKDPAMY